MSKIDNMAVFAEVVKSGGLAAAGRKLGLSPASMTARINQIEKHYNTRLLNRSTRSIALTDAGQRFYQGCLRVAAEVTEAEASLRENEVKLSGTLRVTAPSDFGRQYVAPALSEFVKRHQDVVPSLHLTDGVVNLIEQGFDVGVRFGNLPDSNLTLKHLSDNYRVLCAAPDYLKKRGNPDNPEDLDQHSCLVMERMGEPLNEWRFKKGNKQQIVKVKAAMVSNDGALIRQWAVAGKGIALKSYWDVKNDLASGLLVAILDNAVQGFSATDKEKIGLQLIYPGRRYIPKQVRAFIDFFSDFIGQLQETQKQNEQ